MLRHKISIILTCLLALSMGFVLGVSKELDELERAATGLVTFVDGTLKKKYIDAQDWITAAKDTSVLSGDKFRTLDQSRAELLLKELDVIRLAPRTTIDIVKLYEETKEFKEHTSINVVEGDIWGMVGSVSDEASFNMNTSVVGTAITGTVFSISVAKDSTMELKVYKGEVEITNVPDNKTLAPDKLPIIKLKEIEGPTQVSGPKEVTYTEWRYIVESMQTIQINKYGEVMTSDAFSFVDGSAMSEWVRWNIERDELMKKNR